jgi:hypothetical protein
MTHVSGEPGCEICNLPWNSGGLTNICVLPAAVKWRALVVREVVTVVIAAHCRHGAARLKHKHTHTSDFVLRILKISDDGEEYFF